MTWPVSRKSFPIQIFLAAMIIRLVPVVVAQNLGIGLDDMFQYDMLARSLAAGNGFRWYALADIPKVLPYLNLQLDYLKYDPRGVLTSFRPPLYPAFLALIYSLFGSGSARFFIVRLVQVMLASSLAPLTFFLANKIYPGNEKTARISAWVITCYPMLVIYPLAIATENLFFVLVLCSLLSLIKTSESFSDHHEGESKIRICWKDYRWCVISGLLLGLTCLTRSVYQLFTLIVVLWIFLILKERKKAIVVMIVAGTVIAPWIIRNSVLYHEPTGIESALGYDLYLGYHPEGNGTFQYPQSLDLMTIMDDSVREKIGIQKTIEFINADPTRIPYLILRRAGYFFGLERRAFTYFYSNNYFGPLPGVVLGLSLVVICLPFILVCISAVMGMALLKQNTKGQLLLLFLIGYITPHLLIIAEDRFHLAILPVLAILAARYWNGGWQSIHHQWKSSVGGRVALILAMVCIVILCANWGLELFRDSDKLAQLIGPHGNQSYFSY